MEKIIELKINNKNYHVFLIRKNTKRIIIKVNQINDILLTCPLRVKTEIAVNYLNDHIDWITKVIIKQDIIINKMRINDYFAGKITYLEGEVYNIIIDKKLNEAYKIVEDNIYIKEDVKKSLETIKKNLYYKINEEFLIAFQTFKELIIQTPHLEIKKMKAKWGSCNYKSGRVVINKSLIQMPNRLLVYVMIHEFTHFLYPNHSKNFYKFLEKCLSNYKELEKELKHYSFLLLNQ